jgi:hypothetical protein
MTMSDASPRAAGRRRARPAPALMVGLFVLLFVVPLVTAGIVATRQFTPEGTILEIEMRPTGGTAAQFFWMTGSLFTEQDSVLAPLHLQPGQYERLRFPLPAHPVEFFRYDLLNGPGEVLIRSMRVLDRNGRVVRTIDPMMMIIAHQIESMSRVPSTGETRVVTTNPADDPMLLLRPEWTTAPPSWHSVRFVTPWSLAWISISVLAVIVAGLAVVARDLARGPFAVRDGVWLAVLFGAVLAAKLALVDLYPMPVPFWDQWDGEAQTLYLPFANGGLNWRVMFALHNEHRIFFTRVLALALLGINGQWDPQLQIFANAGLHSLTGVLLAAMLWIASGRRRLPAIVLVVGLVFAPPFALENTLAGFQSAFYFLVLFSLLALWLLGTHRPGSPAWFLGWLCAFCSIFTVAGGLLTVGAVAGLVLLRFAANPRDEWRPAIVTLAALSAVAVVSYAALSPPLAYHAYLKAATLHFFGAALARNLAFPWITSPRLAILVWIPMILMTARVLVRRLRATPLEQISLALGAWVVLQCAAIAYSRGVGGTAPASRYLDMLSFGFVVNSMALLTLVDWRPSRRWTMAMTGVLAIWIAVAAAGIAQLSQNVVAKDGRTRLTWMQEHVRNVRHFVMSGDLPTLAAKRGPFEVPYFNPSMLGGWLGHPYVRSILPAAIREPIPMQAAAGDHAFVQTASPKDLLPVWDSYGPARAKTTGRFESAPTSCGAFTHLRFEVAGNLRNASMRLWLKDTVTGAETTVRPPIGTGPGWIGTSVPCPGHPFTVSASDDSTTSWFAFRQPAETAWASVLAERAIQQWRVLAMLTAVLFVFAIVPAARTSPATAPPEVKA